MSKRELTNNSGILSRLLETINEVSGSLAVNAVQKAVIFAENPKKRTLMIVPRSNDSAKWLAIAQTLPLLVPEDPYSGIENMRFRKGETILLNNCVVIFEELLKDQNKIVVKCSDGTYTMPLSYVHTLTSTQNKKLHSMDHVLKVTNRENRKNSDKKQLFGLTGFVSKSNYTVLVSRNNECDAFITNNYIEGVQLRRLFPWGKIKKSGEVEVLGPHSKSDKPNCLISPDLDRLNSFLDKAKQKPELIIFDGFHHYINQLYVFDVILQFNVPLIVIAEEAELPLLGHLYDRDFHEIRIRNHPDFEYHIELHEASFPELTDVYKTVKNIKNKHPEYSNDITELLDALSILIYQISRLLAPTEIQKLKTERLNQIKLELEKSGLWIPNELKQELSQTIEKLDVVEITSENASKLKTLSELIVREGLIKKIIVVRTPSDAHYYNLMLETLGYKNIKAITMQELLTRNKKYEKVIVYFWPGQNQAFKLLTSYTYQTLSFILYPHEKEWLKNKLKRWHNEYGLDFTYFDMIDYSENHEMMQQDDSEEEDTDFEKLEIRIITRRYQSAAKSADPSENTCKSKLVIFNGSHYAFFADHQHLLVITDLLNESGEEIERKTVNDLLNGDIVLFRDSDNDLIREIADAILAQNNKLHLRRTAAIWREALIRRYELLDKSIRRLKRELKASGCNRQEITIRNWLFDDSIIGPRDINDIVLIGRATMDKELNDNLQQVLDAVSTLRSVHLQAASYLNRQLISKLPHMMSNVNKTLTQIETFRLDQYGTITLASVDRVSEEYTEVSLSSTYKLFPLE